jgi:hypothetical protein
MIKLPTTSPADKNHKAYQLDKGIVEWRGISILNS